MISSTELNNAALLVAVQREDYALVQKLLKEHDLIKDDKWNDYKILIHAVHGGNTKIVQALLSHGCRVRSSKSHSCKTPLCYAVNTYNLEMIKVLLESGASMTDKDSNEDTPLHMAMKKNFFSAVDLMLSKYDVINIDVTDDDQIIHFHIACIRSNVKLIESFIAYGMSVNTYVNIDAEMWPGYSPLHFAVKHQNVKVVKLLLNYGAKYTFLNEENLSPLHLAYYLEDSVNKYQIIDYILFIHSKNPANPVDERGLTHFHIACTRHNKNTITNFIKRGVNIDINCSTLDGCSPLYFAVTCNQKEIVEILLKHGANVNIKVKDSTLLYIAIKKRSLLISKLLVSYGANICAKDDSNCTPIHKAYHDLPNSQEIFNSMMSIHQGKMMNIVDKYGLSIFHIACAVGDTTAVKNFLTRNVDINACLNKNSGEFSGFTGLHFAAMNYHEDVIKLLLEYKANVNALDMNGRSAICLAVQFVINDTIVSKLNESFLKNKFSYEEAGVSEKDVMDFMRKEVRRIPIIELLAENKSDLNHVNDNHIPLLFEAYNPRLIWKVKDKIQNKEFIQSIYRKYNVACRKGIIEIFMKHGIGFYVPGRNYNSILHLIAADSENNQNLEIARSVLMNGCNPNFKNGDGETALHVAACTGSLEFVKLLLKYNADPTCTDINLSTPLHYAAENSFITDHNVESLHTKIMRLLIDNGANIDAKDIKGCTPLFRTIQERETRRALLCLLKANCQVNICNKQGQSPLLEAGRKNNAHGVKLLLDYGADINLTYSKKNGGLLKQIFAKIDERESIEFWNVSSIDTFKVLEMHIEKLRLIDYTVNRCDLKHRKKLASMMNKIHMRMNSMNIFDFINVVDNSFDLPEEDNFITPVLEDELEKMKDAKIDNRTSLYDILFKNEKQMVKHVNNDIFREYLEEETRHLEFQHYGYLLKLKHKEGMKRYVLLAPAQESMAQLIEKNLPDLCFDNIFVYLSNEDLKNLIIA